MLIEPNIRLSRILRNTWQVDIIMIISCIAAYLVRTVLIRHHFEIPSIIPTVLGTAIAFFVGFNNNQAYDRWWEARKIWGALVNDSRSWTRQLLHYTRTSDQVSEADLMATRKKMVMRHLAFVYALKESLRGSSARVYRDFLSTDDISVIDNEVNRPNALLMLQSRDLEFLYRNG